MNLIAVLFLIIQMQRSEVIQCIQLDANSMEAAQEHAPTTPPNTPDPRSPPNPETLAPGKPPWNIPARQTSYFLGKVKTIKILP